MLRRLAQDEQGVALILALIFVLVLSSLSASVLISSAVNHRTSYNSANATHAFALGEEGLANAEGVLYTKVTGGCTSNCVPSSSFTQDGGTVSYSGSLSGSTWTVIGTGRSGACREASRRRRHVRGVADDPRPGDLELPLHRQQEHVLHPAGRQHRSGAAVHAGPRVHHGRRALHRLGPRGRRQPDDRRRLEHRDELVEDREARGRGRLHPAEQPGLPSPAARATGR